MPSQRFKKSYTVTTIEGTTDNAISSISFDEVVKANKSALTYTGGDKIQRALFVICMGESATMSNYVERFVWSAREIGKFSGWIVLLTDAPEGRYESLVGSWKHIKNEKFSIIRPEEKHYIQHFSNGPAMVFKQFKTYVLQYLSQDPRLDEVRIVYYLDVDIVFGNSIWPLFHDLESKYNIGTPSISTSPSTTLAKMWMFEGNSKKTPIQGGQIILDRQKSQPCLGRFRSLMNPKTSTIDQVHLKQMYKDQNEAKKTNDYSSLECEIVVIPQEKKHIFFPDRAFIKDVARKSNRAGIVDDRNHVANLDIHADRQIPILNHIKNTSKDIRKSSPEDVEAYLRYLFRFKNDQIDIAGITRQNYLDGNTRKFEDKMKESQREDQKNSLEDPNDKAKVELTIHKNFEAGVHAVTTLNSINDNVRRAMFLISMGEKAAKTKTVERFVYSARKIGKYDGWIVVLTDASPERYEEMKSWTKNIVIMAPKKEDVMTHYKVSNMTYKRFKSMAIEYIDRDPRLNSVEIVYYLDADIVFGDDINKAFIGLESTYGIGRLGAKATNRTSLGRGTMWMFRGNSKKWAIQGGQMILDRYTSQPCLERWRKGFDYEATKHVGKDQWLLMEMKEEMDRARNAMNTTVLECEIVIMEQKPYLEFPGVKTIKRRSKELKKNPDKKYDYSPIVHLRNDGGTAEMMDKNHRPFITNLLRFKRQQKDPLEILNKVRMETTRGDK